jgi:hypothetical protein
MSANPDDGPTFEELLSEALAGFGWQMAASEIPDDGTVIRVWQRVSEWWNRQDDLVRDLLDTVDLSDGLATHGYFAEWPALSTIFEGVTYGTNRATVANAVSCFESAFNRQFVREHQPQ